jgi:glycosyltransferase involved in cell wall biosynthesis
MLTLAQNINHNKFRIDFLCFRRQDGRSEPFIQLAQKLGVRVIPLDVKGRLDIKAIIKIRKILQEEKVNIIHSHDFKSDFYGLIASIHLGIKRLTTAHGSTRDSFLKRFYLYMTEFFVYRFFHRVISVSKNLYIFLQSRKVPKRKLIVIKNGLDPSMLKYTSHNQLNFPLKKDNDIIFAVIGRLYSDKGHRYFIKVFSKLIQDYPFIKGWIIGDGPERSNIEREIKNLHLERSIVLTGMRSDMDKIYQAVDFVVIPSLTEGLPYVLLESMSLGIPVLATSVGDIPRLIIPDKTGILIPPADLQSLESGMREALNFPQKTKQMSRNARFLVLKKYSAIDMANKTEDAYRSCILN